LIFYLTIYKINKHTRRKNATNFNLGICAMILGIGYCGMFLEKVAARDKVKGSTGAAFLF